MYKPHAVKHRKASFLLLLLFVLYWCGITLFTHSHVVNGVVIVHSHPFSSEHTHTKGQFETIFFLSALQTTGDTATDLNIPLWLIPLALILSVCTCGLPARPMRDVCSRGPPSFLVCKF